jgi:hypothetical protein
MKPIVREDNLHVIGSDINLPREAEDIPSTLDDVILIPQRSESVASGPKKARIDPDLDKTAGTILPRRSRRLYLKTSPNETMLACTVVITDYYDNRAMAANAAVVKLQSSTPAIKKRQELVINSQITSKYFQVH